ncbi:hypothetical protein OsJ_06701 [Oryza sativa Japonica Group]|uniref:Uncharacterized protein n=1 Tax=Oryza sativa subsp. japonica TaxID=39947 RepID=A3A6R7_ORYSJ|nr:hypothetical protein OsJ_06701 [Oryza sativa Japonica Group]BAD19615.1 hypothetical protein [Oryza sativa Japonica Group]BAD21972.1 hypothetical protein [Oryza sativa Japonica Group]
MATARWIQHPEEDLATRDKDEARRGGGGAELTVAVASWQAAAEIGVGTAARGGTEDRHGWRLRRPARHRQWWRRGWLRHEEAWPVAAVVVPQECRGAIGKGSDQRSDRLQGAVGGGRQRLAGEGRRCSVALAPTEVRWQWSIGASTGDKLVVDGG